MRLLYQILTIYEAVLIISVIISWLRPGPFLAPMIRWVQFITEPVFAQVRRVIPFSPMGFDFSPVVVLIIVDVIKRTLISGY